MIAFKVKYFIFGEPVTALVRADSKEEAIKILEDRCDEEDNFTLREVYRYDNEVKGVLLSFFE